MGSTKVQRSINSTISMLTTMIKQDSATKIKQDSLSWSLMKNKNKKKKIQNIGNVKNVTTSFLGLNN
ncbi:MAG TPA: hypothetical protein VFX18_05525 [Candidatus Nitrosocosmicus sp.]|nr:hypothetical protein [Candidatus Nitrosocosmicus sp.]